LSKSSKVKGKRERTKASSVRDKKISQTPSEKSVTINSNDKINMNTKNNRHTEDNLFSMPSFGDSLHLVANNEALDFLRNGPIKPNHKSEETKIINKKARDNIKVVKHIDELVKPRKPTPLSKDRKPSVPINPALQKRQRPTTAEHQKSVVADIYGRSQPRSSMRQELTSKNTKQSSISIRGMISSKPKWKN